MTYDEVVEKVARTICVTKGLDPDHVLFGTASTLRPQLEVHEYGWQTFRDAAHAIVDMLKPKLAWDEVGGDWISNGYEIETVLDQFMLWAGIYEGADSRTDRIGIFPTLEAAKADAEAHAFAEWIKTTPLGAGDE